MKGERGQARMGITFTPEQKLAILNRGGSLLVSAAAGSGKTRVLVERLLSQVEQTGIPIDRFLVITYTKAAAAELRGRIASELAARLREHPTNRFLRRQETLLYGAQISTVHAFCAEVLREFSHFCGLNPDFRLCDEDETRILKAETLRETLELRYENLEQYPDFPALVDTLSVGRDDAKLAQILLDIYERLQSHPDPGALLEEHAALFDFSSSASAEDTIWGAYLLSDAREQVFYCEGSLTEALGLSALDEKLHKNYSPSLEATREGLRRIQTAIPLGWDETKRALEVLDFPRFGAVRACGRPDLQERVKFLRAAVKKRAEELSSVFSLCSKTLLADLRRISPCISALFALIQDFSDSYAKKKAARGVLDFSDLEHQALHLLTRSAHSAFVSQTLSARFHEVMVDEYQDTNEVQNELFHALTRDGESLFMVGDVKQSIYRFRLADPTIFLRKSASFSPAETAKPKEARRVFLTQNFRSRPEVLDGVNFLFKALMSKDFGEMDYTDEQALYPGASFPARQDCGVELSILSSDREEDEAQPLQKNTAEASYAARRIRDLVREGFPVTGKDGALRPVSYADIAILLRAPGSLLTQYTQALDSLSIPWRADGSDHFFDSPEVSAALSMLQIVDNPRQDVPLISVLRSPMFGFSADQLAAIRAVSPDTDFFTSLEDAARMGDMPCKEFLEKLEALRFEAGDFTCHELLWRILDETHLLRIYSAMPNGANRRQNLLSLCALSQSFAEGGKISLFDFLSHLDRLQKSGGKLPPGTAREQNGVQIMSIHKSKGLEFPVVLLCGLGKRINRSDLQKPVLFHQKLGAGPWGVDLNRMLEYPTLSRLAVSKQLASESMSEELRLLYVAMTRAKEKLILTCSLPYTEKRLSVFTQEAAFPVPPQRLRTYFYPAAWILLAALTREEARELREAFSPGPIPKNNTAESSDFPWRITYLTPEQLSAADASVRNVSPTAAQASETPLDPALEKQIYDAVSFEYPHSPDTGIPSKLTASHLVKTKRQEENRPIRFESPRFVSAKTGLSPAEQGVALHLFMQFMSYEKAGSLHEIKEEVHRLTSRRILTPEQARAIDPKKVFTLFSSPLGAELRTNPSLQREFRFSILIPAKRYFPKAGEGEEILLQGVVDCFFDTPNGLVIIDFKTDHISEKQLASRQAEYSAQLDLYARALSEIKNRPVARRILWFFALGRSTEV